MLYQRRTRIQRSKQTYSIFVNATSLLVNGIELAVNFEKTGDIIIKAAQGIVDEKELAD